MRKDRFTDEALAQAKMLAELKMNDAESFAEAYDYARCQRPDGSFYGIPSGKQCRKGSKAAPANSGSKKSAAERMAAAYDKGGFAPKKNKKSDAAVKPVEPKKSQGTRPKAAIEADMKKLTSSGAMQQKGLAGVKARAEHAKLKAELARAKAPKKLKTDFRKDVEKATEIRRAREKAIEKLQRRQAAMRKRYAKANSLAAMAVRTKDKTKSERALKLVEKIGDKLDTLNEQMKKYTKPKGKELK